MFNKHTKQRETEREKTQTQQNEKEIIKHRVNKGGMQTQTKRVKHRQKQKHKD